MANDQPWIPLSIMLSMYGSRINSKLLFRYPIERQKIDSQPLSSYRQLTSSTFHLNKNARSSVSDEFERKQVKRNELEQLDSFSDELLGHILTPGNTKICGKKFDVKSNGIRFVGFPLALDQSSILSKYDKILKKLNMEVDHENCTASSGKMTASTLLSFNLVFVLKAVAEYSIVEKYQELALQLGLAMRFEEKCDQYLTNETRLMLTVHDEITMEPENLSEPEQAYKVILTKSKLANHLRTIYNCLCETGIVSIMINDSTHVSFCLPHRVHNTQHCKNPVSVASIEDKIEEIRPYHGILIFDKKEVCSSLPDDYSPSITRLLNVYDPTKSLQCLASDADLPLTQIYQLTSHLVYWGKACIIYPLCDSNIYVLAATAQLSIHSELFRTFQEHFKMNMIEVLSHFSLPLRLSEFQTPRGLFYGDGEKLKQVVFWLLQHRFLVQMHTYIYFLPPDLIPEPGQSIKTDCRSNAGEIDNILSNLPSKQREAILSIPASLDVKDLCQFINLLKYFEGNHQVEEIMYNENLSRPQVLTLLDKFSPVLLTTTREDSTTAAFCVRS